MSHELRTPLNAIIGFSEIMSIGAFGALNDRYNQYVADILKSGNNLLGMIDEILQFACLESGRVQVDCAPVAVGEVVEQALQRVQEQRRDKKIVLGRPDGRLAGARRLRGGRRRGLGLGPEHQRRRRRRP
jgi:signal transduction histidine kinase